MKYKIKEIQFEKLKYNYSLNSNNGKFNNCKLIQFTYNEEDLEFQTPKVILNDIINEDNKHYLILKVLPTEASRTFYTKINELEEKHNNTLQKHSDWFNSSLPRDAIKSNLDEDIFKVKIPFKYSNPVTKCYDKESNLFNYYHLKKGMEIICLLSTNSLWINFDNSVSYNLSAKEILITKK
jgi:hypothetical protein